MTVERTSKTSEFERERSVLYWTGQLQLSRPRGLSRHTGMRTDPLKTLLAALVIVHLVVAALLALLEAGGTIVGVVAVRRYARTLS